MNTKMAGAPPMVYETDFELPASTSRIQIPGCSISNSSSVTLYDSRNQSSRRLPSAVSEPSTSYRKDSVTSTEDGGSHDLSTLPEPTLCKICAGLDIESMLYTETSPKSLGGLDGIGGRASSCSLCYLIIEALQITVDPKVDHQDKDLAPRSWLGDVMQCYIESKYIRKRRISGGAVLEMQSPQCRLVIGAYAPASDPTRVPAGFIYPQAIENIEDIYQDCVALAELQLLAHWPTPGSQSTITMHDFRMHLPRKVDLELVRTWLSTCDGHNHSREANSTHPPVLMQRAFRLIDVVEERLVSVPHDTRYFALSYVWGSASTFKTEKKHLSWLSEPFSLSSSGLDRWSCLPLSRTVRDAMQFLKNIGERYLWVDAICLVQDDLDNKQTYINNMDSIYKSATATLIAVSGYDSNAGLPGVYPRNNSLFNRSTTINLPNKARLKLGKANPYLFNSLQKSVWDKRAWTYQEKQLSRRRIFFTDTEVIFTCPELSWREERGLGNLGVIRLDSKPLSAWHECETPCSMWKNSVVQVQQINEPLAQYAKMVEDYTSRGLRYQDDILAAFTGVLKDFVRDPVSFAHSLALYGIPPSILCLGLLWMPNQPKHFRRATDAAVKYPSWSWMGWVGPVDYKFHFSHNIFKDFTPLISHMFVYNPAYGETFEFQHPITKNVADLKYKSFFDKFYSFYQPTTFWRKRPARQMRRYHSSTPLLGFWTLKLSARVHFTPFRAGAYRIELPSSNRASGTLVEYMRLDPSWVQNQSNHSSQEFIVLGAHTEIEACDWIYVMLVDRDDTGLCQRVGVGPVKTRREWDEEWKWNFVSLR